MSKKSLSWPQREALWIVIEDDPRYRRLLSDEELEEAARDRAGEYRDFDKLWRDVIRGLDRAWEAKGKLR